MTMAFRTIKDEIVALLGAAAAGRFRVIGYANDAVDATEIRGSNRSVQVYNASGDFSKKSGGLAGPVQHDVTVRIECMASAVAKVDLLALEDPTSTAGEIAAALAAMQNASALADDAIDELIDIVFQIVMDARNRDIGHSSPTANRWISDWRKSAPLPRGEHVTIAAQMDLTYRIDESVDGDPGVSPTAHDAVDTSITVTNDETGTTQPGAGVIEGG